MLDLEPLPTGNEDGVLRWGEAQDLVLAATILGIRFRLSSHTLGDAQYSGEQAMTRVLNVDVPLPITETFFVPFLEMPLVETPSGVFARPSVWDAASHNTVYVPEEGDVFSDIVLSSTNIALMPTGETTSLPSWGGTAPRQDPRMVSELRFECTCASPYLTSHLHCCVI